MKFNLLYIIILLIQVYTNIVSTGLFAQNTVQTIINDMALLPDAALHGTEGLSWGTGEASPQPMPCPAKNNQGEWFEATTNWGQVYIPREGSPATNTRCQVRNLITQLLDGNGNWVQIQSGNAAGAAFVENFDGNASINAGIRSESANGGGISVMVGIGPWTGYNFHYWSSNGRAVIDVTNIAAIFTSCEARLIIDDINEPDDRAMCKNLLQMGGDWWLNTTIGWLPDWSANSGIGSGRAKWVTPEWQSFNMCTLLPEQIIANPPLGVSNIQQTQKNVSVLNIYPNPFKSGMLTIESDRIKTNTEITIYSSTVNLIYKSKSEKNRIITISDPDFKSGLYLVKLTGNNISLTTALMVE